MAKRHPKENLTEQEQKFVDAYLVSFNAVDAAKQAGYSHPRNLGARVIKKDHIKIAIAQALLEAAKQDVPDIGDGPAVVRAQAWRVFFECMNTGKKLYGADGRRQARDKETGQLLRKADCGNAIKALDLIARMTPHALVSQKTSIEMTSNADFKERLFQARQQANLPDDESIDYRPAVARQVLDVQDAEVEDESAELIELKRWASKAAEGNS